MRGEKEKSIQEEKFALVAKVLTIRGAGTSKRQGGQLFQRALSTLYVQSLPPTHCSQILSNN